MKSLPILAFYSLAFAALFAASPLSASENRPANKGEQAIELPRRASGLWRITTISPELGSRANEVCIEEGDSIVGALSSDCSKPDVTRTGDQTIVNIECGSGDKLEITSILVTGDFQAWYRAQVKITSVGPQAQERHAGLTIDARFLAARCH
jgi:hypothetical protein